MFLTQAVTNNGFLFEIKRNDKVENPYKYLSEDEIFAKLEASRKHAYEAKVKDADCLDKYIWYLIYIKGNRQKNILDDFEETKARLTKVAGSLLECENPRLRMLGYKRINFIKHRYFILYRIVEDEVIIDAITRL